MRERLPGSGRVVVSDLLYLLDRGRDAPLLLTDARSIFHALPLLPLRVFAMMNLHRGSKANAMPPSSPLQRRSFEMALNAPVPACSRRSKATDSVPVTMAPARSHSDRPM